jgi:pyruvate,water dikinase
MERGSFLTMGSDMRSSKFGRDILSMRFEYDQENFNSSLGCPLATYEEATLSLVGGKALQCWRLMKYGLPVPPAFIIPTYVYSLHIEKAGVESLINEVFTSNLRDEAIREAAKPKLEEIRKKIMETPLMAEVMENLDSFLFTQPSSSTFAVRSSGSAEDLGSQSFAGQYDTFLYKATAEDIMESVKACWASMFKSHILEYISKAVFLDVQSAGEDGPTAFSPENMRAPQMGVLIMKMVDAASAGVCFSRNLWGETSEVMIEAVPGQGEGLVGGEITPDRYVVNKYTGQLVYQEIITQTHKFAKADTMDGVEKVELAMPLEESVLTPRNFKVRI